METAKKSLSRTRTQISTPTGTHIHTPVPPCPHPQPPPPCPFIPVWLERSVHVWEKGSQDPQTPPFHTHTHTPHRRRHTCGSPVCSFMEHQDCQHLNMRHCTRTQQSSFSCGVRESERNTHILVRTAPPPRQCTSLLPQPPHPPTHERRE